MNKKEALKLMQITKNTYELIAKEFSNTRDKPWLEMELLVKRYVKPGDKVLDVGCGNGRLIEILPETDYWGIDVSRALLQSLKFKVKSSKLRKINYKELDILDLEKLNEKDFNIVFMFAVFNHVASEELRLKALIDIKRLLKPNGLLIMTNWNLWQFGVKKSIWRKSCKLQILSCRLGFKDVMTVWKSRNGKKSGQIYYRAFTKGELKTLLKQAGFKVLENYYSLNGKRVSWWKARNILTVARNL